MPSTKNINDLKEITENLSRAKAVILTDLSGLSVAGQTELRNQLKAVAGQLKVYKNTLLWRGLKETGYPVEDDKNSLTGPSAVVFAFEDEVAVKKVYEYSLKNERPKFKFGFLGKEFLSRARVLELGQLPSREILLAQLVCGLNSPLAGLARVLQGNLRKLVMVLSQIQKSKVKMQNVM
jgi:large subunit ribosomal protein L10